MEPFDADQEARQVQRWASDVIAFLEKDGDATQLQGMIHTEEIRRDRAFDLNAIYPFEPVRSQDSRIAACLEEYGHDPTLLQELDDMMVEFARLERLQRSRQKRRRDERAAQRYWSSPRGQAVSWARMALIWFLVALVYCILNPHRCSVAGVFAFSAGMTFFCKVSWALTPERF